MTGPDGERCRAVATSSGQRDVPTTLVPDIVDQVLFELLDAIDNERLPLAWPTSEGRCVPLSEFGQGELAGWLMGSPGWRHAYSGQRFFDPFADLHARPSDRAGDGGRDALTAAGQWRSAIDATAAIIRRSSGWVLWVQVEGARRREASQAGFPSPGVTYARPANYLGGR